MQKRGEKCMHFSQFSDPSLRNEPLPAHANGVYFAGFFVSLENIPLPMQWLSYVAYVRYGFEGSMLAIYGFEREPLPCSIPYCHFKYPRKFLEVMAMDGGEFWVDVVSLLAFFVVLRVVGYFVLRFKLKSER